MLQGEHSATLLTFIKLPLVIKIFDLSIFEWPFYTDFTVIIVLVDLKRFTHENHNSNSRLLKTNIRFRHGQLKQDKFQVLSEVGTC